MWELPSIKYADIPFPSDGLTIGEIRGKSTNKKPFAEYSLGDGLPKPSGIVGLYDMFSDERLVADREFQKVLTGENKWPAGTRQIAIRRLSKSYEDYGISVGVAETSALIQSIEKAAAAQANALLGHTARVTSKRSAKGPPQVGG